MHEDVLSKKDKSGLPFNNFVGFGENNYESPLKLKTSPRWCPKKKNRRNGNA